MRASTTHPSSGRLLLIDDNQLGLAARKTVLEELGYQITAVTTPTEAIERFAAQPFDLVVTDYKMPHMNGLELIGKLRELQPHIPVILISGFVDPLGLSAANTGADVVIQKSANEIAYLVRSVKRLLSRKMPKKPAASQAVKPPLKAKQRGV